MPFIIPFALFLLIATGCSGQAPETVDEEPAQRTVAVEPLKASAPDWPCWMGADHSGISLETDWITQWPESGLPVLWTRDIGIGFSSVAIKDGLLYTMGHTDGIETVWCLNARTGKVVWQHDYSSALIDNLYEGGPGATPTIHDGRVFTLGKEGQLFCFASDSGKVLWEKELQADLGVPLPEWGFNSSAFVFGDAVIFEAGRVVAYDQATGERLYQGPKHNAGYGSAARLDSDGTSYIVTLDCDALRVTDSADGREVASYPWPSPFRTNSTTPIVEGNSIYISTGYQVGCGLFRFKDDQLELVYENRDMRNHFNNSILLDGYLYGFDGNSNLGRVVHLVCMNHATGEVMWKKRGFGCGSLMIADGKLLILSDRGQLVLADATPDGYQETSRSDYLEGRCWTVPVLLDGCIFGRNAAGKLVAADVSQPLSGN